MKRKLSITLLFHYFHYLKLQLILWLSTPYCIALLRFKGISIQRGSKFYGIPRVYLYPGSKIIIGNNIEVLTARISNFIGINRRTIISTHSKNAEIFIGDKCGFSGVVIGAMESIKIGNNVMVGANVLITDFDWHSLNPKGYYHGIPKSKPVTISDNVFIGYSATILKGVSIGENSIIGANSVVSISIPANVLAAGNPCKVIRETTDD